MAFQQSCIVVVDPISTGGCLAAEAMRRGHAVIAVWGRELTEEYRAHIPPELVGTPFHAEVDEGASAADTADAVRRAAGGLEVVACMVGGDSGVTVADRLSLELGLRTNGVLREGCRRNKSVQQRCVKAAGLRSVREALGTEWHEVEAFVDAEEFPVVLKPVESCGSDGVKLCYSKEDARVHFEVLMRGQRKAGSQDSAVLVQEFLRGREYIVDHVSRDGEHKTLNMVVYDKRPCNGADFVYFGMAPLEDWDSEEARALIRYTRGVLDAMGIRHGPTHGEVIMTADGPCLVEMNCRAAGADGCLLPLQRALTGGFSQVDASLDAFLDGAAWSRVPDVPRAPFRAFGHVAMLVSMGEGRVVSTEGLEQIRQMPSFVSLRSSPRVGDRVSRTTDLFSNVGLAVLIHEDRATLVADIQAIRKMEAEGTLFEVTMSAVGGA